MLSNIETIFSKDALIWKFLHIRDLVQLRSVSRFFSTRVREEYTYRLLSFYESLGLRLANPDRATMKMLQIGKVKFSDFTPKMLQKIQDSSELCLLFSRIFADDFLNPLSPDHHNIKAQANIFMFNRKLIRICFVKGNATQAIYFLGQFLKNYSDICAAISNQTTTEQQAEYIAKFIDSKEIEHPAATDLLHIAINYMKEIGNNYFFVIPEDWMGQHQITWIEDVTHYKTDKNQVNVSFGRQFALEIFKRELNKSAKSSFLMTFNSKQANQSLINLYTSNIQDVPVVVSNKETLSYFSAYERRKCMFTQTILWGAGLGTIISALIALTVKMSTDSRIGSIIGGAVIGAIILTAMVAWSVWKSVLQPLKNLPLPSSRLLEENQSLNHQIRSAANEPDEHTPLLTEIRIDSGNSEQKAEQNQNSLRSVSIELSQETVAVSDRLPLQTPSSSLVFNHTIQQQVEQQHKTFTL